MIRRVPRHMDSAIDSVIRRYYRDAAEMLNRAYEAFKDPVKSKDQFFFDLTMQARIFQFELAIEMTSLQANRPKGFARAIAMKGLIHLVVEFRKHVEQAMIPSMYAYTAKRGIEFTERDVHMLRRRWRDTFKEIDKWGNIRNKATGHFDGDIDLVVRLMEALDYKTVDRVVREFIEFNIELLETLRVAGLPDDHPDRPTT